MLWDRRRSNICTHNSLLTNYFKSYDNLLKIIISIIAAVPTQLVLTVLKPERNLEEWHLRPKIRGWKLLFKSDA